MAKKKDNKMVLEIDLDELERADHFSQLVYAYLTGLADATGKTSMHGFADDARIVFGIIRDLKGQVANIKAGWATRNPK